MSQALLNDWVERLGLQEWRIRLQDCCKPEDMFIANSAGCTEWTESTRCARIQIIDPDEYGERIVPFDYEKTLVHELLHLKTCFVSDSDNDLQMPGRASAYRRSCPCTCRGKNGEILSEKIGKDKKKVLTNAALCGILNSR